MARGQAYMAQKDFSRAALQFKNAVRLQPKNSQAEYQLALAYLAEGKLPESVSALTRVTQLDPKNAEAQTKLAEMMVRSGNAELIREGQKRVQDILATSPENVDALNALALSELELRKPQDAERHLREALAKLPNSLQSSVELATLYLTQGKLQASEQTLKSAVNTHPLSVDASIALGEIYTLMSRWSDASAEFRRTLQLNGREPRALLGLARAQVQLGHREEAEQTYQIISSLPDKEYQHLYATFLFSEGKRETAIKQFELLARRYPEDRDSRSRLVAAYFVSGRVGDGQRILDSALKANPRDVDALLQRSQLLLSSGKTAKAEADLNEVLHFRPDSAEAHYQLAHVYSRSGQAERYRSELTEALRCDPRMLPARIELAQALTVARSPRSALDLLNSAPTVQKNTVPVIVQRNLALLASGNRAGFRDGVEAALKIARVPELLLQDAVVKLLDRDYSGARRSLQEILVQNPEHVRALEAAAFSFVSQNQPRGAIDFLKQDAAQHPNSVIVQQFVGDWLWQAGDKTEARAFYAAANAANPDNLQSKLSLASADLAQGKLGAAQTTLDSVVASHADNPTAHLLLGNLQNRQGNYPEALAQYHQALALDPHDVATLNNLAYLLVDAEHNPDAALSYAQKAVEAAPNSPDALGTLGWVFYHKGLYRSALEYLEKAVKIEQNASSHNAAIRNYHLAMAYFKLKQPDLGRKTLLQAVKSDANLPEAQMARSTARESASQ